MSNVWSGIQGIADQIMQDNGGPNKMQQFAAKFGGAVKSANGLGNWGTIAGDALSGIGSMIGNKYGEDFTDQQKASQSDIRKVLAMIPGYGQLIAAASGAIDAIGTATGMNLSNLDQNSANRAGVGGSAKFNNVINSIPGASMLLGGLWAGDRTTSFDMSDESEAMSSGYAGTVGDMRKILEINECYFRNVKLILLLIQLKIMIKY